MIDPGVGFVESRTKRVENQRRFDCHHQNLTHIGQSQAHQRTMVARVPVIVALLCLHIESAQGVCPDGIADDQYCIVLAERLPQLCAEGDFVSVCASSRACMHARLSTRA